MRGGSETEPLGEEHGTMIKVVFCLRRRPDMSRSEFFRYWNGHHAQLSLQTREAMRVRRYVQNITVDADVSRLANEARGGIEPYDGIAEAWFDSLEDFDLVLASKEGQDAMQAMFEDEPNFIDLARSTFFLVEEHQIY